MDRLITRAEFARRCDVSKAAITKACGKQLKAACVADRLDINHEAVRAYMASKGITLAHATGAPTKAPKRRAKPPPPPTQAAKRRDKPGTKPTAPRRKADDAPEPELELGSTEDLEALAAPLRQIVDSRFGTDEQFRRWLDALESIEKIIGQRLKNEETQGRLISRELVRTHVFGFIERVFRQLLGDAPKTIAARLEAVAKAGQPVEVMERTVHEIVSSQLKPLKATASRVLKNA
jgi:hypothetical protein